MTTQHTPGPWKAERVAHQYGCYGHEITQKYSYQERMSGVQKTGRLAFISTDDDQDRANAQLIALAPTLLSQRDALLAALEGLCDLMEGEGRYPLNTGNARSLIQQVKGGGL